jgi:hypothetical protein
MMDMGVSRLSDVLGSAGHAAPKLQKRSPPRKPMVGGRFPLRVTPLSLREDALKIFRQM